MGGRGLPFNHLLSSAALTLAAMADAFERDLSQSITFLLAIQDDGFAKRFAILLTAGELLYVVQGDERWECTAESVARLIVRLRGRGESHLIFSSSHNPADAYVEDEVVLRAPHHLGWRIEKKPAEKQQDVRLTLSAGAERLRAHG